MQLTQLFVKSISRNLEGVIKVGAKKPDLIEQELDEYVVTDELHRHFRTFFTAYAKALNEPTTNMGVWISGFFGSGKSHLLQIFTYLLENIDVKGRHAIDFFVDEPKLTDPALLETMKEVAANAVQSDVILFNVDSKNPQTSNGNEELLQIFVNVFNEMRGYSSSMPYVAQLEEFLDRKGVYKAFQEAFQQLTHTAWTEGRDDFLFVRNDIQKALVQIGLYDEVEADQVVKNLKKNYTITIQQFAQNVADYCREKGPRHRIVFLVDEMGQYIGSNTRLMLDLQTITEELSHVGGQAWIIVTSQQNIDEVIKVSGDDFSKIQGRFHTRLSLSSANVDEVLKRRILAKTEEATAELTSLYDREALNLKNILYFSDNTPFQRLYENRNDFSETYPFVSYQFDLLQNTLTDIRKNSASGKSIASGERSMLAVFKESAQARKDEEVGLLIPYDAFYDPIAKFVDHIHQQVIIKAGKNKRLDPFDIRLLKVLFLVKYVKTFKANVDNLTTLVVDSIQADRITLRQNVVTSLQKLQHEVLVQKNLDEYSFLTDQEQDINRNIRNMPVDTDEILQYLGQEIFTGILKNQAYKYSNRYSFRYDQYIDNRLVSGNSRNTLSINVLSPYALSENHLEYTDETIAAEGMRHDTQLILRLPPQAAFWEDITKVLQIQKYTQKAILTNVSPMVTAIITMKQQEMEELRTYITEQLRDALSQSTIYIKGDKKDISSAAPIERVQKALKILVETIYNKLGTMGGQEPKDQDILDILTHEAGGALFDDKPEYERTLGAQQEIEQFLALRLARHKPVVLSEVLERFMNAPYGFDRLDVLYCLALLYKKGKITLTLHSQVMGLATPADKVYQYLTQSLYRDKLLLSQRVAVAKRKIDEAKQIRKTCFGHVTTVTDEDDIMEAIKQDMANEIAYIDRYILTNFGDQNRFHRFYHGRTIVTAMKSYWQDAISQANAERFFTYLDDESDDILDTYDDYADIRAFFNPETPQQLELFNGACSQWLHIEKDSKIMTNQYVKEKARAVYTIINSDVPYGRIKDLTVLGQDLKQAYMAMVEKERTHAIGHVENLRDDLVTHVIDAAVFPSKDSLRQQAIRQFNAYKDDILNADSLMDIKIAHDEAIKKRQYYAEETTFRAEQYRAEQNRKAREEAADTTSPTPAVPEPQPLIVPVGMTMQDLRPQGQQHITMTTEQDVDAFVAQIRKQLMTQLKEGKQITILE